MIPSHLAIPASQALKVSKAIGQIYHFTLGTTTSAFVQHALQQIAQLMALDSACWLVLTGEQSRCYGLSFGQDLGIGFVSECETLFNTALLQALDLNSGACVNRQTPLANTPYDKLLQKHKINNQLICLKQQGNNQHLLVLNRKAQSPPFSKKDSALMDFLATILVNAFHHHLQAKLSRHWHYWRSFRAICDAQGHIIEAQAGFITSLQANMPDWDGKSMPESFEQYKLPSKFEYGPIKIEVYEDNGLYVAEAYQYDHCIEKLTPAEIRLVKLLLTAKTNKTMAQMLNIKEKTIENQMKSVFTKLNVGSRTEAVLILRNSDYRFNGGPLSLSTTSE